MELHDLTLVIEKLQDVLEEQIPDDELVELELTQKSKDKKNGKFNKKIFLEWVQR